MAEELAALDARHWVHPVAPWAPPEGRRPRVLASASGAYVTDADGHTLLDGFSGLWCVNVGYGQPSVVAAAAEQMARLPYATGYFDFASEPAIRLAARLAALAPGDLNHVYFTQSGSDSVDSAIRLIRYYYSRTGRSSKQHFIALERGYHGSSAVGAGLTGLSTFHADFGVPTPVQHHIAPPYPYRHPAGDDPEALIAACVAELRAKVAEIGAGNVAAFFCEPVLGSGGVIVPPRGWLRAMRAACADLDILFVADEVITGFGRTGPMFACEAEGVTPDLMTLAKGLTSGYAPMGALLLSDRIHDAVAAAGDGRTVGHGSTYSGHPVSAAVALAVLDLYLDGGLLQNGAEMGAAFERRLTGLHNHPWVGDVRARGLLGAIELVADKTTRAKPDPALKLWQRLAAAGYANGLIFRAFADDVIAFAPPLCCTPADIDLLFERLGATFDQVFSTQELRREPV